MDDTDPKLTAPAILLLNTERLLSDVEISEYRQRAHERGVDFVTNIQGLEVYGPLGPMHALVIRDCIPEKELRSFRRQLATLCEKNGVHGPIVLNADIDCAPSERFWSQVVVTALSPAARIWLVGPGADAELRQRDGKEVVAFFVEVEAQTEDLATIDVLTELFPQVRVIGQVKGSRPLPDGLVELTEAPDAREAWIAAHPEIERWFAASERLQASAASFSGQLGAVSEQLHELAEQQAHGSVKGEINLKGTITPERMAAFRREWAKIVSALSPPDWTPIVPPETDEALRARVQAGAGESARRDLSAVTVSTRPRGWIRVTCEQEGADRKWTVSVASHLGSMTVHVQDDDGLAPRVAEARARMFASGLARLIGAPAIESQIDLPRLPIEDQLRATLGDVNPRSPVQLRRLLFDHWALRPVLDDHGRPWIEGVTTPGISNAALRALLDGVEDPVSPAQREIIELLLEWRKQEKARHLATYGKAGGR